MRFSVETALFINTATFFKKNSQVNQGILAYLKYFSLVRQVDIRTRQIEMDVENLDTCRNEDLPPLLKQEAQPGTNYKK